MTSLALYNWTDIFYMERPFLGTAKYLLNLYV